MPTPLIIALAALAIGFVLVCLADILRAPKVRSLPKWLWALICLISVPIGGIIYFVAGRPLQSAPPTPASPPTSNPGRWPPVMTTSANHAGIVVDNVSKRFGDVVAVDNLSFAISPGRVTGFLGPNGAGKSSTLRIILGLDKPTSGQSLIDGQRYAQIRHPLHRVGSLLDASALHPGRSAWNHARSLALSNGISSTRIQEVLELTGIANVADRPVGDFSLGMKQRLGIALALLGDPDILIFDEPINGLDPEGVHWFRELIRSLARAGRTVFVSSHLMSEMALTADHLIIIGRGKLLADTSVDDFVRQNAHSDVFIRSPQSTDLAPLLQRHGATVTAALEHTLVVTGLDAPAVADLAFAQAIPIHELTPRHATLEQAYLDLTASSRDHQAGGESHGPR